VRDYTDGNASVAALRAFIAFVYLDRHLSFSRLSCFECLGCFVLPGACLGLVNFTVLLQDSNLTCFAAHLPMATAFNMVKKLLLCVETLINWTLLMRAFGTDLLAFPCVVIHATKSLVTERAQEMSLLDCRRQWPLNLLERQRFLSALRAVIQSAGAVTAEQLITTLR